VSAPTYKEGSRAPSPGAVGAALRRNKVASVFIVSLSDNRQTSPTSGRRHGRRPRRARACVAWARRVL